MEQPRKTQGGMTVRACPAVLPCELPQPLGFAGPETQGTKVPVEVVQVGEPYVGRHLSDGYDRVGNHATPVLAKADAA